MRQLPILPNDYHAWIDNIKSLIRSTQIKAAISVNENLIRLYWQLGQMITEKQENANWGDVIIRQVAIELKETFPNMTGFSRTNLFYMKQFYLFYRDASELVQQAVGLIPWGHNILIFSKSKQLDIALFYLNATLENNWSRSVLDIQLDTKLHERQGKSINNFHKTLEQPQAELANETLKDPYMFDFLTFTPDMHELDMEKQLTDHIIKFLLELGNGFAFIGRQYPLTIGEKDYALDLLFYHIRLRCFVVIDLKMRPFTPENAGKMNFYLSATDDLLKHGSDNPTIGLILCKSKNRIEVEYALRDLNKPIGVSDWILTQTLPEHLKSSLPSIEQLERELSVRLDKTQNE